MFLKEFNHYFNPKKNITIKIFTIPFPCLIPKLVEHEPASLLLFTVFMSNVTSSSLSHDLPTKQFSKFLYLCYQSKYEPWHILDVVSQNMNPGMSQNRYCQSKYELGHVPKQMLSVTIWTLTCPETDVVRCMNPVMSRNRCCQMYEPWHVPKQMLPVKIWYLIT